MPRINNLDSFSQVKDHFYDNYKNLGYRYDKYGMLRCAVSPELFANTLNDAGFRQIERMFECMINAVRKIKLHFAITFPKNSRLIN